MWITFAKNSFNQDCPPITGIWSCHITSLEWFSCLLYDFNLLHSHKRASYSKSAAGLLPCSHQADIRMRSHRLLRLDDNKSAASCQQAWCKLIVKTFYPQAQCKLLRQLAASLQTWSCNKSDLRRLHATWWSQQIWRNLVTDLQLAGRIHNLHGVYGVSGCMLDFPLISTRGISLSKLQNWLSLL